MRLEFLNKKLARLEGKCTKLDERCKASADVAEVRSLTEELEEINAEIEETRSEITMLEAEQRDSAPESTQNAPAGAERHNGGIVASYAQNGVQAVQERSDDDPTASMEYRKAFMHYFQRGAAIPAELMERVANYRASLPAEVRAGDTINTGNTGAVIPVTVMREIINTVRKRYGNLYSKVTKLAVPGAVDFPISELQADFHWITESTVSPEQEIGPVGTISFKYNTAEIRIAQTFLSAILSIEAFEAKISEVIAIAYLKAMDTGIVKGTGNGQMLGILNDVRVTGQVGHTIALTAAEISNWTSWRKKFFAKLPLGYRSGEFIFNVGTVDAYLETMADANNNPVFRQATGLEVNDGDAMNPSGRFFGRAISLVEPDVLVDFDTASSGDQIGIFWQPEEYVINENFGFMMRRFYDDNRNKWINKAITVVDGKVLNPNGIYIITKA